MADSKRYYWLKLQDDFFSSKRIKKLRRLAGGDTYTIIYLKMQLKSLKTNGVIEYTGIEDNFAKELALDIDEDEENVAVTVNYLLSVGLLEAHDNDYQLPYVSILTGSENASAQRVRDYRERQKALQCNAPVTQVKQLGNVEKEIDIEIEKDKEKDMGKTKRFSKPTIEEVKAYCEERNNNVDYQRFYDFYESKGWKVGKNTMKDWQACVRTWERSSDKKSDNRVITKFDL